MQNDMNANVKLLSADRRNFLITVGGVSLGLTLGACASSGTSGQVGAAAMKAATKTVTPNAWMTLGNNGIVTLYSPASEMGQATNTAMPLLVAEEMDLDWSRCKVEQAPFRPKDYGNPRFGGGMTTGASRTVQGYYEVMRLAGLQARAVLLATAANHWKVPVSELSTKPHTVVHKASNRKIGYGELADLGLPAGDLPKVDKSMLKPMSQFRLIGKDVPRVDGFEKVTGRLKYGIDTQLPGMLFGAVLRSPVQGEKPLNVDSAAARAIPGVRSVVNLPYGVGIIASNTWAAFRARDALKVEWSKESKGGAYDSDAVRREFAARAANASDVGVPLHSHGNADAAMAAAGAKVVGGVFTTEALYHACMEPMNATAKVDANGNVEVWAPAQSATLVGVYLGMGAQVKPEQLTVNITQIGGGYGRRVEADYCVDAVLLARTIPGTPVKVIWTRADDIRRDKVRPAIGQNMQIAIDKDGLPSVMKQRIVGEGIYARVAPPAFAAAKGVDLPTCEGFETVYNFPNHLAQFMREQRALDAGFWRGVGGGYTKFAMESVMDEAAAASGLDPLAFRLRLLDKAPRAKAVLHAVADMANWSGGIVRTIGVGGPRRALGMAYSDMWNSHIGMVVDVSVSGNAIRVHNIWAAVDCGHVILPGNVARQIEGSAVFGVSAALKEKLTIKGGVIQEDNFSNYQVLRMDETPLVSVKLLVTDNYPGGIGEVGLPPVAPAIANAVAALTGTRLRALPLNVA